MAEQNRVGGCALCGRHLQRADAGAEDRAEHEISEKQLSPVFHGLSSAHSTG
jgi:hypothetical protein